MLNSLTIVGRLVSDPQINETENGKKISIITLAVTRHFKNANGEYDTDFIDCTLWAGIAEKTREYCEKGNMIAVKGRIQSKIIKKEDGTDYKKMEIIAERVSFLSNKIKEGE